MRQFTYAVKLTPDKRDGGYVVTCRDLPEAITQGDSVKDALAEAADALEEAIAARIDDAREIPEPTARKRGASAADWRHPIPHRSTAGRRNGALDPHCGHSSDRFSEPWISATPLPTRKCPAPGHRSHFTCETPHGVYTMAIQIQGNSRVTSDPEVGQQPGISHPRRNCKANGDR